MVTRKWELKPQSLQIFKVATSVIFVWCYYITITKKKQRKDFFKLSKRLMTHAHYTCPQPAQQSQGKEKDLNSYPQVVLSSHHHMNSCEILCLMELIWQIRNYEKIILFNYSFVLIHEHLFALREKNRQGWTNCSILIKWLLASLLTHPECCSHHGIKTVTSIAISNSFDESLISWLMHAGLHRPGTIKIVQTTM